MESARDLIEHWVSIQTKEVQNNVEIVDASKQPLPFTLHIDKNTPKAFTPRMPPSAGSKENFTAARVTCSDTLVGCIYGYGRTEIDFLDTFIKDEDQPEIYRGGYEICRLDYEFLVKPTAKLVPEAKRSGETWLVSYSEDTLTYKPKKIGKIFFTEITFAPAEIGAVKEVISTGKGYFSHTCKEGIFWDEDTLCAPGTYRFEITSPGGTGQVIQRKPKKGDNPCMPCSPTDYDEAKKFSAARLDYKEALPASLRW